MGVRLKRMGILTLLFYYRRSLRPRAVGYLARHVRFRGIWRNWRYAGLRHLDDRAMMRFCLFDRATIQKLHDGIAVDRTMKSHNPRSRYWKRLDPCRRPTCDVLDVVVLVLRELATTGYQHCLETDMGIPRGVLGRQSARTSSSARSMPRSTPIAGGTGCPRPRASRSCAC